MKRRSLLFMLLLILLSACQDRNPFSTQPAPTSTESRPTSVPPLPVTAVIFRVEIPADSPPGQQVYLNLLDEVTGLALNAQRYPMEKVDDRNYRLETTLAVGSVVKYRYTRQGPIAPAEEHLSNGLQVRYRMYYVQAPGEVQDTVSRWTDTEFKAQSGRIMGQALDKSTGQPLSNLLVAAGGAQALTHSDGTFIIEGLPPGVHNLVAYTLDGSYRTFQQGARVAVGSTTPTELRLEAAPQVSLVFVVTLPEGTIPSVPIRIAGNLYQLGNTFANLSGGVSTIATRMPVLEPLPDGRYTLTLTLPAGADLRYTYTMGDGFWNTELSPSGGFYVRQIIVPETNGIIEDTVQTWNSPGTAPITFDVTVPADTPPGDFVSIQFKPLFGWTEPIPMWPLGNSRWAYVLNSPLGLTEHISYRFCRSGQCGAADDAQTAGPLHPGLPLNSGLVNQSVVEKVESWAWTSTPLDAEAEVVTPEITPRGPGFMAGIEFAPAYQPSWLPRLPNALDDIQNLRANWAVFSPTWTYTRSTPPILEIVAGADPLWPDLIDIVGQASARGMRMALFPTPRFPSPVSQWWEEAPRDYPWWQSWFERYRIFLLHHADLAARAGASSLILGGDWLEPAMPGGTLADGSPSGAPDDAEARWRRLIADVRSRYTGPVMWALSDKQASENPPPFLDAVDSLYVMFSAPLASSSPASLAEMEAEAGRLLDIDILSVQSAYGKPVVLGVSYPSAEGSALGCVLDEAGECLDPFSLLLTPLVIPSAPLALQEQADIYESLLNVINLRPWITGFVSRGFYLPTVLQEKSASVHGKPAQEVIRSWYPKLLEVPAP